MAKYTEDTKQNTDLHQQIPAKNLTPEVDRQCIQHYTLENDQATTHRKCNKEEKMEVDRKPPETITRQAITWNPQGRGEEVGHETPGKETRKMKRRRWDTPGEKWRVWPRIENGGVLRSLAYILSEQTGISK
ncbi:hypothetical protein NP493_527g05028 [Ridgeia piscesae]|uniref:Uncharacterized protein n=1 Tax=Ridgeia piscesae TaxID=27915 RepID=A0AAD9KXS8_RIDPI|nr:hypothetical protein NP493_527g05028 [Ridgeia piscesae]